MNNVNVDFKVEDSIKRFLINKRRNIINIKNVENNHRIDFAIFKKIKINEIFNKFYYDNVNKHDESCVYVFVIDVF